MKFRANKMLGLAVGERSILVAEVSIIDGRRQVTRAGELTYSEGVSLANGEAVGIALGQFLKAKGFTARTAVFGFPAKWVLTKMKEVPPVAPSMAADLLRIQVESEFSAELKDLVYDYAGESRSDETSQVLLVAVPQKHIDQARAIADGANIEISAITPTSVALSAATSIGVAEALVLSITPSGTELAAQRGEVPSLLRHVGSSAGVTAAVAGEVRRATLMIPRNGSTSGNGSPAGHVHGRVVVWDDAGLDDAARKAVNEALGPTARLGELSSLGAGDAPNNAPASAAAVALAVAGITEGVLLVDLLHSRLAPPKKSSLPPRTVLASIAGALALVIIVSAWVLLDRQQSILNQLVTDNKNREAPIKLATEEVAKIKNTQNWHMQKPRFDGCWAEIAPRLPPFPPPAREMTSSSSA